jgi:hypothetical protein
MKLIPIVALALALAPSHALARGAEHGKRDIKLLNDAAAALSASHPDLSTRLKDYALREAGETEESGAGAAGARDKDVQLLKDSAAALDSSDQKLAKGLKKFARKESREARMKPAERPATPQSAPEGY